MTYEALKKDPEIRTYITQADATLSALGYTEHSFAHVTHVAITAGNLLGALGKDERTVELAKIAGYLHDIGNLINRSEHSQSGALLAFSLLQARGFSPLEIAEICTAIGNHDEGTGEPVSDISAALILADKSDVRRSRVRNQDFATFDIHDRVNFSVTESALHLDAEQKNVELTLTVDTAISSVMEYFEIFLERMVLCRKAAERLGLSFRLCINNQHLL